MPVKKYWARRRGGKEQFVVAEGYTTVRMIMISTNLVCANRTTDIIYLQHFYLNKFWHAQHIGAGVVPVPEEFSDPLGDPQDAARMSAKPLAPSGTAADEARHQALNEQNPHSCATSIPIPGIDNFSSGPKTLPGRLYSACLVRINEAKPLEEFLVPLLPSLRPAIPPRSLYTF